MQEIRRPAGLPDPPRERFLTPPSNGDQPTTRVSTSSGIQGLTDDAPAPKAAQPTVKARVRARAKPKASVDREPGPEPSSSSGVPVSYTHLRAHET